MTPASTNRFLTWIRAMRPQTLPAALVPVMVGAGLAYREETFSAVASLVALVCAILIQIGTNFANDYYDHVKGADTADRVGFQRATASGIISTSDMFRATLITMSLAFLTGLYLVWIGGWPILIIGIASLLCGIAYTGGPLPLGYNGLGDVFVFLFFGIIAVMGTFYVNSLRWTLDAFLCSLPIGALATNILVINNLRDIKEDEKAGKNTLGVLFGPTFLRVEYTIMTILAYLVPFVMYSYLNYIFWILAPLLSIPSAIYLTYRVWTEQDRRELNPLLKFTGQWMTLYGILFTTGILAG